MIWEGAKTTGNDIQKKLDILEAVGTDIFKGFWNMESAWEDIWVKHKNL